MAGQPVFFDGEERLRVLSAAGDALERVAQGAFAKMWAGGWRHFAQLGSKGPIRRLGLGMLDRNWLCRRQSVHWVPPELGSGRFAVKNNRQFRGSG
jgi:hypothetical protein